MQPFLPLCMTARPCTLVVCVYLCVSVCVWLFTVFSLAGRIRGFTDVGMSDWVYEGRCGAVQCVERASAGMRRCVCSDPHNPMKEAPGMHLDLNYTHMCTEYANDTKPHVCQVRVENNA